MNISFIIPSRNNLKYLKWSYASIRKNQGDHNVQICVADDASTDGTAEWLAETCMGDDRLSYLVNDSGTRVGHTILYDRLVNELARHDVCIIFHADMYLVEGSLDAIQRHLYTQSIQSIDGELHALEVIPNYKTIVSLTRIEPPLHPKGVEKILADFGTEPEDFDEAKFNEWVHNTGFGVHHISESPVESIRKTATTEGIFAPWAFFKKDFQVIGGHDPLYAPQSKEDCSHGDTLVMIIEHGYKKFVRINELWDMFSELINIRDDNKETIDLKGKGIRVLTPLMGGDVGIRELTGIIRQSTSVSNLVTIRDRNGIVVVTKDHSLIDSNLGGITSTELMHDGVKLWTPVNLLDWKRRNVLKSLNIEYTDKSKNTGRNDYEFPQFDDIDEYGTDQRLRQLCDFLGFYVAEGSTNDSYVKICGNDYDELKYYADVFCELFNATPVKCVTSVKCDCDDVYSYSWGSKKLAKVFSELVGNDSHTKKVPDFIFNLPKTYQEYFLYGYLRGDGYLGTSIQYSGYDACGSFSVDKRLFFKRDILNHFTWKSCSGSDILTSGLYYLLMRTHPESDYRINYVPKKNVYTIDSYKDVKHNLKSIEKYDGDEVGDVYVYDLEVSDTNMFIGGVGMIGLHNSDIFNRFQLNGVKFIQTWKGFVYHMTCRGSRFNPTITEVGTNSAEWDTQNIISSRNFIRKWGHFVKHDAFMKPIIPHKYNIGLVVSNSNHAILGMLEPWCSNIYVDLDSEVIESYIVQEQPNTTFDLRERIQSIRVPNIHNDVMITVDGNRLTQDDVHYIQIISEILANSGVEDSHMAIGNLAVSINKLNTYEQGLVVCENNKIKELV